MSLKPLLNAAVFPQLSMWRFVSYTPSNALLSILTYKFTIPQYISGVGSLQIYSLLAKILTLNIQEVRNLEMIFFGITVLLEYGMRIAVY